MREEAEALTPPAALREHRQTMLTDGFRHDALSACIVFLDRPPSGRLRNWVNAIPVPRPRPPSRLVQVFRRFFGLKAAPAARPPLPTSASVSRALAWMKRRQTGIERTVSRMIESPDHPVNDRPVGVPLTPEERVLSRVYLGAIEQQQALLRAEARQSLLVRALRLRGEESGSGQPPSDAGSLDGCLAPGLPLRLETRPGGWRLRFRFPATWRPQPGTEECSIAWPPDVEPWEIGENVERAAPRSPSVPR